MVLKRAVPQRFFDFTEILKKKILQPNLKLVGFSECKHHMANEFEISDSLKEEISNSENLYILTNQKEFNSHYILSIILKMNNVQDEELYNRSTISFNVLSETEDKELIEQLNSSDDYLFVFNY